MPPLIWPPSLPQVPLVQGYQEAFEDRRIVSVTDIGPGRARPRSLGSTRRYAMGFNLSDAQVATLETFWTAEARAGEAAFELPQPRTKAPVAMAFTAPPSLRRLPRVGFWHADVATEVLSPPGAGLFGSVWTFQGHSRDQHGRAWVTNGGGSETYATTSDGVNPSDGLGRLLTGGQFLSLPLAYQGWNDPWSHVAGMIYISFRPAWNNPDGNLHYIFAAGTPPVFPFENLLSVAVDADGFLAVTLTNAAGQNKNCSGLSSWTASQVVQIIAFWTADGTLGLYYAKDSGAFTDFTAQQGGAASGILSVLPGSMYLGADVIGNFPSPAIYDTVAFFKRVFPSPQISLAGYAPLAHGHLFWPPELPQRPLIEGYDERLRDLAVQSDFASGTPERRRRTGAAAAPFSDRVHLTTLQASLFDTFYEGDTLGGVLPFAWTHPRHGVVRSAFAGGAELTAVRPGLFALAASLEVLPS